MGRKPSARETVAVGAVLLVLATACSRGDAQEATAIEQAPQAQVVPAPAPAPVPPTTLPPVAAPNPAFDKVSELINRAIAANELPGAVVLVGHGGKVVFRQTYGERKLAGEPGLDGSPTPA